LTDCQHHHKLGRWQLQCAAAAAAAAVVLSTPTALALVYAQLHCCTCRNTNMSTSAVASVCTQQRGSNGAASLAAAHSHSLAHTAATLTYLSQHPQQHQLCVNAIAHPWMCFCRNLTCETTSCRPYKYNTYEYSECQVTKWNVCRSIESAWLPLMPSALQPQGHSHVSDSKL